MRKCFPFIAMLVLLSCGEERKKTSEPEKIVDTFIQSYKSKGPRKALSSLLPTNKYLSKRDADTVAVQLERLTSEMGDLHGFEKIKEASYGEGIVHLTYIVKYSRQPVRLQFKFYQPGNGWRIQNFSFQTDFIEELDELGNPKFLPENYEE